MDENVYLYLRLDYGEYIELKDGIINIYSHFGGRVPIIDKLENFILVSYRVLWKKTVYITMMHLPSDRRYPSCKYFIKKGELISFLSFHLFCKLFLGNLKDMIVP